MVCCKCAKEIADNSIFCNWCGKKQITESTRKKRQKSGNGLGSVYPTNNGKYAASITIGFKEVDGRFIQVRKTKKGFATRMAANLYLPELRGNIGKPKDATIFTLYEQCKPLFFSNLGANKVSQYKTAWKRLEPLHHRYIGGLSLAELQAVVGACKSGYYPRKYMKTMLTRIYEYACIEGMVSHNIANHIMLPTLSKPDKDAFTKEEVATFWELYNNPETQPFAIGNRQPVNYVAVILAMIYTASRPGEMRTILTKNVHIEKQYMTGGIKTDAGKRRHIILCNKILPVIKELMQPGYKKLVPGDEKSFYAAYWQVIAMAGVRKLSPNCCRHTGATALAEEGTPPAIIQAIMGHEDYSTTLQYTHIRDEELLKHLNNIL